MRWGLWNMGVCKYRDDCYTKLEIKSGIWELGRVENINLVIRWPISEFIDAFWAERRRLNSVSYFIIRAMTAIN
jgi:hypothetical protein